jgi:cytochrome b6-f complex subunit 5
MNLNVIRHLASQFTLRLDKLVSKKSSKKSFPKSIRRITVVEPLLSGIVLGLIPVTLIGLFVAAYMQYRRGDQLGG